MEEIEKKELLAKALEMSKWEKIDSGVHQFTLTKVEVRKTDKSKRDAIVYSGTIMNSKGIDQVVNVVDLIDKEDGFKFGAARLVQFINHFGLEVNNVESINDLVQLANRFIGESIRLEFVKKVVNGAVIREKVFIFK